MKAMILAAGRGERMRPLTDTCPKPLLCVAGKPLIVWQIEKLAAAGFKDIIINHAWLGQQIEAALGNGEKWGVTLRYSPEKEPLETAGGIAQALPLLKDGGKDTAFVCVAADIFSDYDYADLVPWVEKIARRPWPGMYMVMVPNPPFNPRGDFAFNAQIPSRLSLEGDLRYTFSSIGVYDTRTFCDITPGTFVKMRPYYDALIPTGNVSGEIFTKRWENVGTPEHLQALDAEISAALLKTFQLQIEIENTQSSLK